MLNQILRATSVSLSIVCLITGCLGAEAPSAAPEPRAGTEEAALSPAPVRPAFCGGIAGIRCPAGQVCLDNPNDSCSPACGGADCGGICVRIEPPACGGIAGIPCPTGSTCVDVPGDG